MSRSTVIATMNSATRARKTRTVSERHTRCLLPRTKDMKMRPKLMAEQSIATVSTISAAGFSKEAMLALRVLNPQVLHADIACAAASNQPRPTAFKVSSVSTVRDT